MSIAEYTKVAGMRSPRCRLRGCRHDRVPRPRPVHGDSVQIIAATTSLTITGSITSQGVLRDGRGLVELTLPDADPQQRRDLARSQWFQYELYRGGALVYSSGHLRLRETRRNDAGELVVSGSP